MKGECGRRERRASEYRFCSERERERGDEGGQNEEEERKGGHKSRHWELETHKPSGVGTNFLIITQIFWTVLPSASGAVLR